MKFNILKICIPALAAVSLPSCSDWMKPEAEVYDVPLTEIVKDDAYYANLRAFKESEHSVSFGWFSEWGEGDAATTNMLQAVPDSMDIISLWNNFNLTPKKKADLDFVTKVKGTKVVLCTFVSEVGCLFTPPEHAETLEKQKAYWGWVDGDEEAIHNSIKKWTKAVSDSLYANGFQGIDIDYEPGEYGGSLCRNSTYLSWFVEEMGKYIGPKSGTDRLFIIDGYIDSFINLYIDPELKKEIGRCFNYFVTQAYTWGATSDDGMLEGRLRQYSSAYSSIYSEEEFTNRLIVTENLESALDCLEGGFTWKDDDGSVLDRKKFPSLFAFASWQPDNGFRKGGFGAFRFSNEKVNNPRYKWMRKAIQQQNPAPGYTVVEKKDCHKQ